MKVNSLWIDLVNLRSETYADGSRIPTMEFGTPQQDAERRYCQHLNGECFFNCFT
jgi:tRNA nucleotidyltransferase/poly(A) polymerase